MNDDALIKAVAIGGTWIFATITALVPRIAGWFMLVAFGTAIILTLRLI